MENDNQSKSRSVPLRSEPSFRAFQKRSLEKGIGLIEYASGYGARADGHRLKRIATAQKP
jgi:hypothetical protein